MKMRILSVALMAALALGTGWYLFRPAGGTADVFAAARRPGETLVIDAGHGGEDGGAVSLTGVPESGINLAIAQKLDQLLGLYGMAPVMLRTEDISLHDGGARTARERKRSDLHNRVEAVEAVENATLLSIHQNTYPEGQYHGAQVFYGAGEGSQDLAQFTQETLRAALDPENGRAAAKIPDSVYLMNHISCRAILVECGFLSNPEEEALLRTGDYQTKVAAALAAAWLQYDETTGEEPG